MASKFRILAYMFFVATGAIADRSRPSRSDYCEPKDAKVVPRSSVALLQIGAGQPGQTPKGDLSLEEQQIKMIDKMLAEGKAPATIINSFALIYQPAVKAYTQAAVRFVLEKRTEARKMNPLSEHQEASQDAKQKASAETAATNATVERPPELQVAAETFMAEASAARAAYQKAAAEKAAADQNLADKAKAKAALDQAAAEKAQKAASEKATAEKAAADLAATKAALEKVAVEKTEAAKALSESRTVATTEAEVAAEAEAHEREQEALELTDKQIQEWSTLAEEQAKRLEEDISTRVAPLAARHETDAVEESRERITDNLLKAPQTSLLRADVPERQSLVGDDSLKKKNKKLILLELGVHAKEVADQHAILRNQAKRLVHYASAAEPGEAADHITASQAEAEARLKVENERLQAAAAEKAGHLSGVLASKQTAEDVSKKAEKAAYDAGVKAGHEAGIAAGHEAGILAAKKAAEDAIIAAGHEAGVLAGRQQAAVAKKGTDDTGNSASGKSKQMLYAKRLLMEGQISSSEILAREREATTLSNKHAQEWAALGERQAKRLEELKATLAAKDAAPISLHQALTEVVDSDVTTHVDVNQTSTKEKSSSLRSVPSMLFCGAHLAAALLVLTV